MIKVVIKRPNETPVYTAISEELDALQAIVGGYIEIVPIDNDFVVICNEEGRLNGLPFCWEIAGINFVGPIILAGTDGEELADVPFSKDVIDILLEGEYVER